MEVRFWSLALKESIKAACRRSWKRLRGNPINLNSEPVAGRGSGRSSRRGSRRGSSRGSRNAGSDRSPFLVINNAAEFSPSGSPTGTALGIPAEHLLDEESSEIGELIQPIPPGRDNPFATPTGTSSDNSGNGFTSTLLDVHMYALNVGARTVVGDEDHHWAKSEGVW
ncbi:hypothetical protein TrVGV298_000459 [Trichoderma virens]|nr:hypothetical protein TrVGV298_000459 [Trichoderma virens]